MTVIHTQGPSDHIKKLRKKKSPTIFLNPIMQMIRTENPPQKKKKNMEKSSQFTLKKKLKVSEPHVG
jgi:hypothetical protein